MPNIPIRWSDNTKELADNLKAGLNQIEATRASAEKMAKALGGDNLIRAAHNYVAAVNEVGGANKLIGSEQDRVNAIIGKAIDKYTALGKEAPDAMRALYDATKRTIQPVDALAVETERLAKQLGGGAQSAQAYVSAVEKLGGASKLTATEQAQVNGVLTEAIAKYKALGKEAPAAMLALADATKKAVPPEDVRAQLGRISDELKGLGTNAKAVGTVFTASLTAPIVGGATLAVKAAIDLETAFAGVKKTINGTPEELAAINTQIREMAKVTPASAVELSHIAEQAGQLGVAKENVVAFTKTIVDISTATNLTADEAGTAFAKIANVMKMPQEQFSNLGSAVVALGNFGASTEQEMLSMAQRIAAAGATAGMTAPQVLGIANALSSVGIEAEAGGTAISKVINTISMDVASGGGKLAVFAKVSGESAKQFSADWRDNAGVAFSKFMQGLADARSKGGEELLGLIKELGLDANVRLVNAFMSAANAGNLMKDSIELGTKAFQENTEVARASEERYKTVANQFKILRNNLTDVAVELGNALLPVVRDVVADLVPFTQRIEQLLKAFEELPSPLQEAVLGVTGFLALLGPGLFVIGTFVGALGDIGKAALFLSETEAMGAAIKGIRGLRVAVAELATVISASEWAAGGPIGLAIGAFIAAAVILKDRADTVAAAMGDVGEASQKTGQLITGAKDATGKAIITLGQLAAVGPQMATAFHMVNGKLVEVAGSMADVAGKAQTLADRVRALTAAQRADIESKVAEHESIKAIAQETGIAADVVKAYIATIHDATTAKKEHQKAVAEMVSALDGEKKSFETTFEAARLIIGLGPMEADEARRIVDALDKVHAAHGKIPPDLEAWRQSSFMLGSEYDKLDAKIEKVNASVVAGMGTGLKAGTLGPSVAAMQAISKELDAVTQKMTGMNGDASTIGETLKHSGELPKQTFEDLWKTLSKGQQVAATLANTFKAFPTLLIQALTGGGGVANAFKALFTSITQDLFGDKGPLKGITAGLAKGVASAFSGLGKTISGVLGSAVSSMLPALGGLIAPLIDKLSGMFSQLFGGASKQEKEGRQIAADFEKGFKNTADMINKVGAAYMANGKSAADAQAAIQRLWAAEKQGADATKRALQEINAELEHHKEVTDAIDAQGFQSQDEILHAADIANQAYEEMDKARRESGQYTQEQVDQAYHHYQELLAQLDGAAGEAARAWLKIHDAAGDAATASTAAMTSAESDLKALIDKRNTLAQGIAAEAPEQVMGVIEEQQRGQLAALDKEIQDKADAYAKLADETGQKMADAIVAALKNIHIDPVHVPVVVDQPQQGPSQDYTHSGGYHPETVNGEVPEPASTGGRVVAHGIQHFALGGPVLPSFSPIGTDIVPAMLTPGELVLTASQQAAVGALLSRAQVSTSTTQSQETGSVTNVIIHATDAASFERLVRERGVKVMVETIALGKDGHRETLKRAVR